MAQVELRARETVETGGLESEGDVSKVSQSTDRPLIERLPKRPLGLKQGN